MRFSSFSDFCFASSLRGHDRGQFFLAARDGMSFALVDGKGRKLSSPKLKNPKHLRLVCDFPSPAHFAQLYNLPFTDAAARKVLAAFSAAIHHSSGGIHLG